MSDFTEESKHQDWFFYLKEVILITKGSWIIYLLINGIKARHHKSGQYDRITALLSLCIIVVSLVIAFSFMRKYIIGFFLLIILANYFNFLSHNYLINHLETHEASKLKSYMDRYAYMMNSCYLLLVILVIFHQLPPKCSDYDLFPSVLYLTTALYVANLLNH